MAKVNYYEVLRVPVNAGDDEIVAAHIRLVSLLDPDLHPRASAAAKQELREAVKLVDTARGVLTRPALRREHDSELGKPAPSEPPADPTNTDGCMICGSTPANHVVFRRQQGMLYRRRIWRVEGTVCRDCGRSVGRDWQSRTLIAGWWGMISLFVNSYYVLANTVELFGLFGLDRPDRDPATASPLPAPLDPKPPLILRLGPLFFVALIVVIILVNRAGA